MTSLNPFLVVVLTLAGLCAAAGAGPDSGERGHRPEQGTLGVSFAELSGNISVTWAPDIFKADGQYYVVSSGHGLEMRVSDDLVHWRRVDDPLPGLPQWAREKQPEARALWAPDLSYFDGQYHLYYAVSTLGARQSAIGFASSPAMDPEANNNHWQDQGMVIESFEDDNWNAIDPNVVSDDRDRLWMSYGSYWSGLRIVRLNPETGRPASGAKRHRIANREIDGPDALEAPYIVKKNGFYYLFVSFGRTHSNYEVRVGRSRDITGPYHDRQGRPMMQGGGTLVLTGYDGTPSPGHQAVLINEKRRDWLLVRYLDPDHNDRGTLQLRQIVWDRDGWPLVGEPYSEASTERIDRPITAGKWKHTINFEEDTAVTLRFQSNNKVHAGELHGTWRRQGDRLTITWQNNPGPGGEQYLIHLAENGRWYVGRTDSGRIIRGIRLTTSDEGSE